MAANLSIPIDRKRIRRTFNQGRNLHMGDVVQMADGVRGVYQGLSAYHPNPKTNSTSITIDLSPCSRQTASRQSKPSKLEEGHVLPSSINVDGTEVSVHYQLKGIKEISPAFPSSPYRY